MQNIYLAWWKKSIAWLMKFDLQPTYGARFWLGHPAFNLHPHKVWAAFIFFHTVNKDSLKIMEILRCTILYNGKLSFQYCWHFPKLWRYEATQMRDFLQCMSWLLMLNFEHVFKNLLTVVQFTGCGKGLLVYLLRFPLLLWHKRQFSIFQTW